MGRFEKITKIDGKEVTLETSYNGIEIYREIYRDMATDTDMVWLVQNEQVIFSFNSHNEIDIEEEYRNL